MWRVRKEIHGNLGEVFQRCLDRQSTDAERGGMKNDCVQNIFALCITSSCTVFRS